MIKKILKQAGIHNVATITKIEVGFSNDVYCIDDKYILKISKRKEDNTNLKKDIFYCNLFQDSLPVPKIIYSGESEKSQGRAFFIYEKIKGENLYNLWHLCSETQRKNYVQQICEMLKVINRASHEDFKENWGEMFLSKINAKLRKLEESDGLPKDMSKQVKQFAETVDLKGEGIVLVNWDLHFDNFLVRDNKIVGFLDFENCMTAALDYQMVLVKRMVRNPTKYASEHAAKFISDKDYENLIDWYEEYYPAMFDFKDIKKRLRLYAIEHCLDDIYYFPKIEDLKKEVKEYLEVQITA